MKAAPSLRDQLRAATAATHRRLHRHEGLGAAARGVIDLEDYRHLLIRLYGFHRAFEESIAGAMPDLDIAPRSRLIEGDLQALGALRPEIARLPLCRELRSPSSEAAALGALYVVEGSALGGVQIAAALEATLEPLRGQGRRFFEGDPGQRAVWPTLLARLENLAAAPRQAVDAVGAAVRTFETFEEWMRDWRPRAFLSSLRPAAERRDDAV